MSRKSKGERAGIVRATKGLCGDESAATKHQQLRISSGGGGGGREKAEWETHLLPNCEDVFRSLAAMYHSMCPQFRCWFERTQKDLEACWPANLAKKTISFGSVRGPVSKNRGGGEQSRHNVLLWPLQASG